MNNGFEEILAQATPEMAALARLAKALISDVMPAVVEVAWPRQNIIGYGVGPKKMSEQFCYLGLYKKHVNLGFYYGAELPDANGLLQGTGKQLRHVKLTQSAQLEDPALRRLLLAASGYLPRLKPAD